MIKLEPGMICTFDAYNTIGQNENGIVMVQLIKRVSWRPFGRSIWKVVDANHIADVDPFDCPALLLKPSGMCVIRYPSDFPKFNEKDMRCINDAIFVLEPHSDLCNRLKVLKEKMEFVMKLKEV